MQATNLCRNARREAVREILLRKLLALTWPGADGLTLQDVLQSYPGAAERNQVPTLLSLAQSYPELSMELEAFFANPMRWLTCGLA